MADEFEKRRKEVENLKSSLENQRALQKELATGLDSYYKTLKQISGLQKDIAQIKASEKKELNEIVALEQEEKKLLDKKKRDARSLTEEDKKRLKILKAEIPLRRENLKYFKEQTDELEKQTAELKKSVKQANILKASFRSAGKVIGWGVGKIKESGIFEMDKEIRAAAQSMGIGNRQYKAFADNMMSAADTTTMMGADIKDLAKLQRGYSEEIGRSVRLSQKGLVAMAGMSEGTGLGAEFAAQMAGSADDFGMSVESAASLVEDTMNIAGEMGVNSSKAASVLQKNLKMAQKYGFKGGVKAMGRMAADALRLKLDMDGIAGMAEKVFRPEGAIEMAAQLSVMGGEFAKLGNPMQLMFKARNDFEGFAKDIGKAAGEFVTLNKETGVFEVSGGLARDRIREISKITGIGVEELTKMAEAQKKIEAVGAVSPINMNEKDKELVSSLAEFNKKTGQFEINVGTFSKDVKDLKEGDLESIRSQKQSLDERAEQSKTFDETIMNMIETIKQTLLPFAIELKEGLGDRLSNFIKYLKEKKILDGLRSFAKSAGELAVGVVKFIADNPFATLLTVLGGWAALKAATWFANGMTLGLGFNKTANAGGGGSPLDMIGGKGGKFRKAMKKGGFSRNAAGRLTKSGKGLGRTGNFMRKAGKFGGNVFGKGGGMNLGKSLAKGGKAFTGLGALAIGADIGRSFMDDPDSNLGKSIGVGGKAAEYAGYGALLGSVIPGVGNVVGGVVGGLIGGGMGIYDEFFTDKNKRGKGTSRLDFTGMNDGVIFNPKDKFLKMDDGALIAGTNVNGNRALAQEIAAMNGGGGSSTVEHKYGKQVVEHKVSVDNIDSDFALHLTKSIAKNPEARETLATANVDTTKVSGQYGKLTPNPNMNLV